MKKANFVLKVAFTFLVSLSFFLNPLTAGKAMAVEDPIARQLLNIVLSKQPAPYGLPGSDFHYHWAQFMMSMVAAEQNGYVSRQEAIDRISGVLTIAERLQKYHGFMYDRYDIETNSPTTARVNFQGWYLYSLVVIKNTYPELAARCNNLLGQVDYYNSGIYEPGSKSIPHTYFVGYGPNFLWPLYDNSASEVRVGYMMYSYITGDKTPWFLGREPSMEIVGQYTMLKVWHNFNFDMVLLHNQVPEYGYYKKSWVERFIPATLSYMDENGMSLFPIREEPLHSWQGYPGWPNTEHRESMPWLTWYFRPDAPVMEKAFIPGYGISRHYDNWNFYWSYGSSPALHQKKIGSAGGVTDGRLSFSFYVAPSEYSSDPAKKPLLKSVSFLTSYNAGNIPSGNLIVALNGNTIREISPSEISASPTSITISGLTAELFKGYNYLVLRNADTTPGKVYNLYRYSINYRFSKFVYPAANNILARMDSLNDLDKVSDDDTSIEWASPSGGYDGNRCLKLDYDFKPGGAWAIAGKDLNDIDISSGDRIEFYCKGTGSRTDLEVKLEDIDGTTYGYRLPYFDFNQPWQQVSIPYSSFSYYWGGKDTVFDWHRVKFIWFTIFNVADTASGSVYIDDVSVNGNIGVNSEMVSGAAMEIKVDGQRSGEENCMAFLSRVAVAHNYNLYANVLNDPKFIYSLVSWVGDYDNRAELARYIHNVSTASTKTVYYRRPDSWQDPAKISVKDINGADIPYTLTSTPEGNFVVWDASPSSSYKVDYLVGKVTGKVTFQGRTNHTATVNFELRLPSQTTPIATYQVNTAADGTFTIDNVPVGTYDLTAKTFNTLRAKFSNLQVNGDLLTKDVNFSLLGGDADNNNGVSMRDFSILRAAFGTVPGQPRWDPRADFNANGQIEMADFSILRSNFGKLGAR